MKNCLIPLVAVSALTVSSASAAITYSDTFTADSSSNYTPVAGTIAHNGTVGTGGGGGLSLTPAGLESVIYKTGFTLEAGSENRLDMSVFIKKTGAFDGDSNFFLGITTDNAWGWGGGTAAGKASLGVFVSGFNQFGIRLANPANSSSDRVSNTSGTNFTDGNWYKLTTSLTKPTSGDVWTVSGSVQDWGSAGTTPGTTLFTLPNTSVTVANADFNNAATTHYGLFGVRTTSSNAADNFTMATVPEPSAAIMLLGGAGMLGVLRRRR